jgi:hypothetical protein
VALAAVVASGCGARLPEPQATWGCGPSRCEVELRLDPERMEACAPLALPWACDGTTCWTQVVGGDEHTLCAATLDEAEAWCAQVQAPAVADAWGAVDEQVAEVLVACPDVLRSVDVVGCDPVEALSLGPPCVPAEGP